MKSEMVKSDIRPGDLPPLLLTSGGHYLRPVQTCSLEDLLSQQNIYCWQAGSTYPTGMMSCLTIDLPGG